MIWYGSMMWSNFTTMWKIFHETRAQFTWKLTRIVSCIFKIFSELTISIVEVKNIHFCRAKPRRKWIFWTSTIEIVSKLKFLIIHIILCHSRHFGTKTGFLVLYPSTSLFTKLRELQELWELRELRKLRHSSRDFALHI